MTLLEAAKYFRTLAYGAAGWPIRYYYSDERFYCLCGANAYTEKELEHKETCRYYLAEQAIKEGE